MTALSEGSRAAGPAPGQQVATVALAAGAVVWATILGLILNHRVFVSTDTVSNYGHVWWIADGLWHGHGLRWRMPVLGHGRALTYPYAFVPWTLAALVWPALGERSVGLALVVGSAGLVASTYFAFPELIRSRWIALAALANPVLVAVPIIGQLPFAWALALFFVAIGCWRRDHRVAAVVFAGVAQATHAAVVLPLVAATVAVALVRRWDRRLLWAYCTSLILAVPAVGAVALSPVFEDTSAATKAEQFVGTVAVRALVLAFPLGLAWLAHRVERIPVWVPAVLAAVTVAGNVVLIGALGTHHPWLALRRRPDPSLLSFIHSPDFQPGATYRILRAGDGKIGMYQLIRNGARVDSEFFPESIDRRSFPDVPAYRRFLSRRRVDVVLVYANFDAYWHTNEHALLAQMATRTGCGASAFVTNNRFAGYRIEPDCPSGSPAPTVARP